MSGEPQGGRKRVGRLLPLLAVLLLAGVAGSGIWFGTGGRLFAGPTPATIYVFEVTPSASVSAAESVGTADPGDSVEAASTEGPTSSAEASGSAAAPSSTATHAAATPATTPTPLGPVHWFTPTPVPPTPTATPTHAPTATPHMPNLTVGPINLGATHKCGTAFLVNAMVTNTGPVTSSEVDWRVADYYGGTMHYGLGGGTVEALAPGRGIGKTKYITLDYGCGGTHVVFIQVDTLNHLTEGNEGDNQSHVSYVLAVAS